MPFENIWGHHSVHKRFLDQITVTEFMHSIELVQSDARFDELSYAL